MHREDLVKNGLMTNGAQRWLYKSCKKSFLNKYIYKANEQDIKEQIIDMTLNGSGVRGISGVPGINKNTVCSTLLKNPADKSYVIDN